MYDSVEYLAESNDRIWENKQTDSTIITWAGYRFNSEWAEVRVEGTVAGGIRSTTPISATEVLLSPPSGFLKCNVDASFSLKVNKVGIGMFLLDEGGNFIRAKTHWISLITDVIIGESMGLLFSFNWV